MLTWVERWIELYGIDVCLRRNTHFSDKLATLKENYDKYLHGAFSTVVSNHGTFIDCGAQFGFYTVLALHLHPQLKVVALEPHPFNYSCLAATVEINKLPVTPIQAFASDVFGFGHFSDLTKDCAGMETVQRSIVKIPIDALELDKVSCIKIDTEGQEQLVLAGCHATLQRCRPSLIIELCEQHLQAYGSSLKQLLTTLANYGYRQNTLYFYTEESQSFNNMADTLHFLETTATYGCDLACTYPV